MIKFVYMIKKNKAQNSGLNEMVYFPLTWKKSGGRKCKAVMKAASIRTQAFLSCCFTLHGFHSQGLSMA